MAVEKHGICYHVETVGDLLQVLQGMDPEMPVALVCDAGHEKRSISHVYEYGYAREGDLIHDVQYAKDRALFIV